LIEINKRKGKSRNSNNNVLKHDYFFTWSNALTGDVHYIDMTETKKNDKNKFLNAATIA
jgi:hypothetical protein